MKGVKILWVDDEIDLLKIQILFLEEKGHTVYTANNGYDAIDLVKEEHFDIIFLDENMPGKSGLDVLPEVKKIRPTVPVVMITKNEEEESMDEAIGLLVSDYLIKPVNPKQIILSIKKNVENKQLISAKTKSEYQNKFNEISKNIYNCKTASDWADVYKNLIYWEQKINSIDGDVIDELIISQKEEANSEFCKFIIKNYESWYEMDNENKPFMPFDFFRQRVLPALDNKEKVFVLVIDNLRFDQWKIMQPLINDYFTTEKEEIWYSMLPTTTQYARNAMFAGLTPLNIYKQYPDLWVNDNAEGGKNLNEAKLLENLFNRYRRKVKFSYDKILNNKSGYKLNNELDDRLANQLSVVIYNFVDIMSHARTEMKMMKELAYNDESYKALTITWFEHSPLFELIKLLSENKIKTFITTDHGSVNIMNPIKVVGDRETNTNLRYKQGRNLKYNKNEVFEITKPENIGLPSVNLSSSYIFSKSNDFFAYPNNYNYYVRYYKNSFQHGGISLEELLIPVITLLPK